MAFTDAAVPMDDDMRRLSSNYAASLFQLAVAQAQRGRLGEARTTVEFIERRLPLAQLGQAAGSLVELRKSLEAQARERPAE